MSDREKWMEVFKAGTWTDSGGNTREWTEEDLDNIIENYNNQSKDEFQKAPLCYGHERKDSDPALGWVEKLKRVGNSLYAYVVKLSKDLIEQIKEGAYEQVSIGMEEDDSGWMLNHVAILGAVHPAVGGLTPLSEYFSSHKSTSTIKMDIPAALINFADDDTIATAKAAQQPLHFEAMDQIIDLKQKERSDSYKIEIKDIGNRVKPKAYSELTDEEFGDPVHYRFPLTKLRIKYTLANWNKKTVKDKYSEAEQEIINNRILKAAADYGIQIKNENYSQNQGVINMSQEQYNSFVSEFTQFLTDTYGEDIANSAKEWLESKKGSMITAEPDGDSGDGSNNSKPDEAAIEFAKKEQAMLARIEQLENEGRKKDFKAYLDNLTTKEKKLAPAQFEKAMAILEMGHKSGKVNFSQNSKTSEIEGVQLVKEFMESYDKLLDIDPIQDPKPTPKPAGEFSGVQVDEERMELHNKTLEFMEKQKADGKTITYGEALEIVNKGVR